MHRLAAILLPLLLAFATPLHALDAPSQPQPKTETAIFAAGCFWCVESDFDTVPGVLETVSGYTGGHFDHPTYNDVSHGDTGHVEAVKVTFDPSKVSYQTLLDFYWHHVDATDGLGQFCDRGSSYKPVIFVKDDAQRSLAEASRKSLVESNVLGRPIAVEIAGAQAFWPAEDEHQNYYKKNPIRYGYYRLGCGRDARLRQLWGSAATH